MERVYIVIAAEYWFGMETYSKSTCMREMESLGLEAELVRKRRKMVYRVLTWRNS